MTESKGHTELPWSVSEAYPFMIEKEVVGLADGHDSYVVAEVKKHSLISSEEALANLDFIVTAVNTYPAVEGLVKALEFYSGMYEPGLTNPNDGPWGVNSTDFGERARSALSRFRSVEGGAE